MLLPIALAAQEPKLEPVKTTITVVEHVTAETPANITAWTATEIQETPGVNLDDRLRDIPGFTLFRRNSSLVAHPTTQGVSLRGVGSSGASRSLVLWDGIPVNDPFGGWVYWTRFAPVELERVEVSRGASTSLFGDRAMGGAIGLFSRPPERQHLDAGYEGGNRNTHEAYAGYSNLWSRWAISGFGRAFTTDGYFLVPQEYRGSVDTPAGVRFVSGDARIDYLGGANQFFFRTDVLAEERKNGTVLQTNSTGLGSVSLHYQHDFGSDALSMLGYHERGDFRSAFSAVAGDRNTERLTYRQEVPSEGTGGAAMWQHHQSRWDLVGGADVNRAEGYSTDSLVPTGKRVGGGIQTQHGVFAQADLTTGPARFFVGARHSFTGQGNTFLSPSAGIVLGRSRFRARASVYRSFRAPTLNELFREFRVGNIVTQANSELRPETMLGGEAGFDVLGEASSIRFTAYRNSLDNLITNVTLSVLPNLITRQRRNAAAATVQGFELEGRKRIGDFTGEISYMFVNSRFSTGYWLSQVPRHQGSAQLTFQKAGTLASAGVRTFSAQFDDDLNQNLLPGFATVQAVVRQHIARGLSAILEVDNLLDRSFATQAQAGPIPNQPILLLGEPRMVRAGLRWSGRIF